ncbi:MAG: NAD(P)H-dependent oxidoreductase [Bacteroidota bacterium]
MNQILILFAHPKYEQSRANQALIEHIKKTEGVTIHDLYQQYPDYNIDVYIEKDLLQDHDIIIWHHPFYWYSCPPLLKQWIDMVLEFGWAYGPGGNALSGKVAMNTITTGGTREVYCSEGYNHYTIGEFLRPFEQTAKLCKMDYLPPFSVMGTHRLTENDLGSYAQQYSLLLEWLKKGDLGTGERDNCQFINDIPELQIIPST